MKRMVLFAFIFFLTLPAMYGDSLFTMQDAVANGDVAAVTALVKKGADVNVKADWGWTPLHVAAAEGYLDIVKFLVSKGADINIKNKDGKIPLFGAVGAAHMEAIKLLVKKCADLNARDNYGRTVLHFALYPGPWDGFEDTPRIKLSIVKYLVEHEATPGVKNKEGKRPVDIARELKLKDIVKYLESKK
jgi:ankyrin repeat protein